MTATKSTDNILLEVINHALSGIGDTMMLIAVRTSRSSCVRLGFDLSCGLLDAKGEIIGQGFSIPLHLGCMGPALKACLSHYNNQVHPEDIFIINDPYEGGTHLPDIFLFKPVFQNGILLGFACAMSHHSDIGGRVAGGNACDSTEIYQEGLRIPPIKLYDRGVPNDAMFRILEKAVRIPHEVTGDLMAQVAAINIGTREWQQLAERHGPETLLAAQDNLLEYTEKLTRAAIRELPEGSWTFSDYIDDDGISDETIKIQATITKKDDQLYIDFDGTSPQCKGAIQPVFGTTQSVTYAVVKSVLGTSIPNTGGYIRPITVTSPEGTFTNPLLPAPVAARALGAYRIAQAVFGAFGLMLPQKMPACWGGNEYFAAFPGYDKTVSPWKAWIQMDPLVSNATGGSAERDGADAQQPCIHNSSNIPAEIMEIDTPIMVEEYALLQDTEGAGKSRGGLGMVRQYRNTSPDTQIQIRADRVKYPPYGLHGGQESAKTRVILNPDSNPEELPNKVIIPVQQGDSWRLECPGGGGWGNPIERNPEAVLTDVIEGKVSLKRAKDTYGVVIREDLTIDINATEQSRSLANA